MITILESLLIIGASILYGLYLSSCMILGLKISIWISHRRRGSGRISSGDLENV
jgi:hypothetical protein